MKLAQPSAIAKAAALALGTAFCGLAAAQSTADLLKELEALKARVAELEAKQKAETAKPASAQWGMTPEQAAEFNRISVKTEALEDARDASGFKGLKIGGYIDPVFIYNKNQDRAGFQLLNAIGDGGFNYDNSFFGQASIDFQKETDSGTRWRLTLTPNRGLGAGIDSPSIVHEATVSVPLTDLQTRFIAGQMPDWSGYEYLPPTQTKLITHNLLFDFTLPFTYTGAGLEITSGKWITKAMLANMNASKRNAGEKAPVIAYRVDYSRGEFQGFGFAGVHGKAANFRALDATTVSGLAANPITGADYSGRDTAVNLFEVDGYFIRGDWTVQGQVSVGSQKNAAITADPTSGDLRKAQWWGVSALAAYKLTPRLEAVARGDYISNKKNGGGLLGYGFADDVNGIGPDATGLGDPELGANRTALALGMSYLFNQNTVFKAEYRLDRASQPVFIDVKTGEYRKSNQLFGASVVVSF
jgi:hypothetical protein